MKEQNAALGKLKVQAQEQAANARRLQERYDTADRFAQMLRCARAQSSAQHLNTRAHMQASAAARRYPAASKIWRRSLGRSTLLTASLETSGGSGHVHSHW